MICLAAEATKIVVTLKLGILENLVHIRWCSCYCDRGEWGGGSGCFASFFAVPLDGRTSSLLLSCDKNERKMATDRLAPSAPIICIWVRFI